VASFDLMTKQYYVVVKTLYLIYNMLFRMEAVGSQIDFTD
jgi:hypothetical protein